MKTQFDELFAKIAMKGAAVQTRRSFLSRQWGVLVTFGTALLFTRTGAAAQAYCDETLYDDTVEGCCNQITLGQTYNLASQGCCGGNVYTKATQGCCGTSQVFTLATEACCGTTVITKASEGCCNGNRYQLSSQGCCGTPGQIYTLATQKCCSGTVVTVT